MLSHFRGREVFYHISRGYRGVNLVQVKMSAQLDHAFVRYQIRTPVEDEHEDIYVPAQIIWR